MVAPNPGAVARQAGIGHVLGHHLPVLHWGNAASGVGALPGGADPKGLEADRGGDELRPARAGAGDGETAAASLSGGAGYSSADCPR